MSSDFLEKIGADRTYEPWPEPRDINIVGSKYRTPDGNFPRVTNILKVLGLGGDKLQEWAAEVQRDRDIDAAVAVWMRGVDGGAREFAEAMLDELGPVLAHKLRLEAAGDLGTSVHDKVRWWHQGQMGVRAEEPSLPEAGELSFMAYQEWWNRSGLTVVRTEQPVWSKRLKHGGTIDVVAALPDGRQGIVDLKTSKHLYDRYHLQCIAYLISGRRWAPLEWAVLVRLPKTLDDAQIQKSQPVEVRPLGKMYDRILREEELIAAWESTAGLYHMLMAKQDKREAA